MKIIKDNIEYNSLFEYVKADLDYYIDFILQDFNLDHSNITDNQIKQSLALIDLNNLNAFDNEGFDYDTDFIVLNNNNDPIDTEQLRSLILDNLESVIESDY